jgi:ribose 5-phosphate isomerase B
MKIYFAADHAGFLLKNKLISYVEKKIGCEVEDCGAYIFDPSDDYPVFVSAAVKKLSRDALSNIESRAIIIGGSGQAEAVLANKFKGVRCAVFYGGERPQTDSSGYLLGVISASRAHDNTNALALGNRTLSYKEAEEAVKNWIETPFSNAERHIRRLAEIDKLL